MRSSFLTTAQAFSLLSLLCFFVSCQSRSTENVKKESSGQVAQPSSFTLQNIFESNLRGVHHLLAFENFLFFEESKGPRVWDLAKAQLLSFSFVQELKNSSHTFSGRSQKIYSLGSDEAGNWFLKVSSEQKKELESIKFKDKRVRFGPTLSPDEKWLFYSAAQAISKDVYIEVLNRDLSRTFALVTLPGNAASVAISPSGKKIAWRQMGSRKDIADIYVADLNSVDFRLELRNINNLTQAFRGLHLSPAWVSDSELLFASNFNSSGALEVFYTKIGSDCVQLYQSAPDFSYWMPSFQAKNNEVYWVSNSLQSDAQKILRSEWVVPSGSCLNLSKSVKKILKGDKK